MMNKASINSYESVLIYRVNVIHHFISLVLQLKVVKTQKKDTYFTLSKTSVFWTS